ncbi:MAG: peroxiredoxin [Deltaproteobacteria bacterium]|nr:peroxiredoxin [Deltaproteobacteria bacterium]
MSVEVGQKAPDFELADQDGKKVRLSDYRGKKNVVLAFYPADFTPVCTKELCSFRDDLSKFQSKNAQVLGVSVQPQASKQKFSTKLGLNFPILADDKKEVARAYGVMGPLGLHSRRATFIIDKEGAVRHKDVEPLSIMRPNDAELLSVLDGLGA